MEMTTYRKQQVQYLKGLKFNTKILDKDSILLFRQVDGIHFSVKIWKPKANARPKLTYIVSGITTNSSKTLPINWTDLERYMRLLKDEI